MGLIGLFQRVGLPELLLVLFVLGVPVLLIVLLVKFLRRK